MRRCRADPTLGRVSDRENRGRILPSRCMVQQKCEQGFVTIIGESGVDEIRVSFDCFEK